MSATEDIRGLAHQYLSGVKETGSGDNINAVCPFHRRADGSPERHPSFYLNTTTGLYYCHSCGAAGNLRMFLKNIGVSPALIESMYKFVLESAESHAKPPPDPTRPNVISKEPINEQLLGLLNYRPPRLIEQGFTEETLQYFEIGFDTAHNRTTYPIRDLQGQLVGISGRSLYDDQKPKYKIYDKEYEVWDLPVRVGWDKRTVLYHAFRVYPKLYFQTEPEPIVVVEGFKACMWLWQCGIKNVVALLGNYLTWEHQWILERIGSPVYLFLDNNSPGWQGAYKAARRLSRSLPVYIVEYPERLQDQDDAQPDDLTFIEAKSQCQYPVPWHQFIGP